MAEEMVEDGTCNPSKDCSYYYNLDQCGNALSNGCTNSLDCISCPNGKICQDGSCISNFCLNINFCSNYNDDTNCTADVCDRGICKWNSTSGSSVSFYVAGNLLARQMSF